MDGRRPLDYIDYYGVTFDHLVPADDPNPEVLAISIIEVDNDGGVFANKYLSFSVDPPEYTGKKVLAVPRCCQHKKGTQDQGRINGEVAERNSLARSGDDCRLGVIHDCIVSTTVTATHNDGFTRSKTSHRERTHNYGGQTMHNKGGRNDSEHDSEAADTIGRNGHRKA